MHDVDEHSREDVRVKDPLDLTKRKLCLQTSALPSRLRKSGWSSVLATGLV